MSNNRYIDAGLLGGRHAAITPDDDNDLPGGSAAVYVGGAGAVAVGDEDGTVVVYAAVPAGSTLPIRATRVLDTDTTATNLVAVY